MAMVTVQSVVLWMLIAAFTGLVTYLLYKRGKMSATKAITLPILAFYLSFVLTITLLERNVSSYSQYNLELFWSYRAIFSGTKRLAAEVFWNVVLFVPIGCMTAFLCRKKWLPVLICAGMSLLIEVTQLLAHRGLFEFDDIFHNTLGAVIGVGLCFVIST